MITLAKDGLLPERGAPGGAAIAVGTVYFDGSTATSRIVNVTSSDVVTNPAIEMGPTWNADIFTSAVAVTFNRPLDTRPSASHATGRVVVFTVRSPVSPNW